MHSNRSSMVSDMVKAGLRTPHFGSEGSMSNPLWLLGIEPGFGRTEGPAEHRTRMVDHLTHRPNGTGPYNWSESFEYPFGRIFGWVYQSMRGSDPRNYAQDLSKRDASELVYKNNFFPICFPTTNTAHWERLGAAEWTGWPNKESYRADLMHTRLATLGEGMAKHQPRVVLVAGLSMLDEAVMAFGRGGVEQVNHLTNIGGQSGLRCYHLALRDMETPVLVLPFFGGRGGINSHDKAQAIGAEIRRLTGEWS